jgi:hypothetical protein
MLILFCLFTHQAQEIGECSFVRNKEPALGSRGRSRDTFPTD